MNTRRIDTTSLPVTEVPFPSITVCPDDKPDYDKLGYIRRYFDNFVYSCPDKDNGGCPGDNLALRRRLAPVFQAAFKIKAQVLKRNCLRICMTCLA